MFVETNINTKIDNKNLIVFSEYVFDIFFIIDLYQFLYRGRSSAQILFRGKLDHCTVIIHQIPMMNPLKVKKMKDARRASLFGRAKIRIFKLEYLRHGHFR